MNKLHDMNKNYDEFLFSWTKSLLLDIEDFDLYVRVFARMQSDGSFLHEFTSPGIFFHIVHAGTGIIEYEGKKIKSGPGTMFIFWTDSKVKYYDSYNSNWDYTWFWLAGRSAQRILSLANLTPDKLVYDISKCPGFLEAINTISECFKTNQFSLLYPMNAAWVLVNELINELSDEDNLAKIDGIARRIRIFIENNPLPNISVDAMAEHFKVNRSTIFRLFKSSFGISPKEYIEKLRFEKACQLLNNKNLKIKDIAKSCGYENQCYFSSAFQKHLGITPSRWRNKN